MKKKLLLTGLGLAGACAACCAVPLLVPVIAGLSVAALAVPGGLVFMPEFGGLAALAGIAGSAAAGAALWWARRRRAARACASAPRGAVNATPLAAPACGCSGACKAPTAGPA